MKTELRISYPGQDHSSAGVGWSLEPAWEETVLAEGAAVAHFVRLLSLADTLDADEYDVHFHTPVRFHRYLVNRPYAVGDLATMPGEQ